MAPKLVTQGGSAAGHSLQVCVSHYRQRMPRERELSAEQVEAALHWPEPRVLGAAAQWPPATCCWH